MFSGGELRHFPLGAILKTILALAVFGFFSLIALGGWALFALVISHLRWI
jgi:hypothetical protein